MIGLDTNVLIRHIVQDNKEEARAASRLIESHCTADDPGIVSLAVLCEMVWVLDRGYRYDRSMISSILRRLLSVEDLRVERSDMAWLALNLYEKGKADLADYIIGLSHRHEGAQMTYTFDRRATDCELFKLI